ncbi:hypothetical protein LTR66_005866 [Elasticomyces elasticus]|nr:hypothetical protein LTR66_005866 [Elasticomyces elasticus]
MITKGGLGWYAFYYIMVGVSAVEFFSSLFTFWAQTGAIYLAENPREAGATTGRTREALKNRVTWIFALFIFVYCGMEGNVIQSLHSCFFITSLFTGQLTDASMYIVSLGGWIVVFMTRVRNASSFVGGVAATGFWGGMTVGRLFLPFLTTRVGELKSMILYLCLTIIFELIFWLVPNLVVSAVSAAILGVFIGPMFPTAIVVTTKLLPRCLHVGTIGFGTSFGGSGGAIFPFIVGAIAQAKGVRTLQPIILSLCIVLTVLWILLLRTPQKNSQEKDLKMADETRNDDQVEA